MTEQTRNVAILIFDEVEVLDFCGPFEVFSVTGKRDDLAPFNVYTVGHTGGSINARNGLTVTPSYSIDNAPAPDILLVPGGYGTRSALNNEPVMDWIKQCNESAELMLSVCTGALMLAKAGMLEGLKATTHWGAIDLLREMAPETEVLDNVRYVDNGRIILSAGVSAGIDMAFYVVARLMSQEQARETAHYMEYDWRP